MKSAPSFQVEQFKVERLSKKGLWLVTTEKLSDLGLLFLRAQEFYESANPEFVGKPFTISDYIKWYSEHLSHEKNVFSYFDDFRGFNVPKDCLDKFEATPIPDLNHNDVLFAKIVQGIRVLQPGEFYVVGAQTGHIPNINHETAHGMFYLVPKYKEAALKLSSSLPPDARSKTIKVLKDEGYGENVLEDEIQAYYATGLLGDLEQFEHLRAPFMKLFFQYKKTFIQSEDSKAQAG